MRNSNPGFGSKLFRRYSTAAAIIWTAIIIGSLLSNIHLINEQAMELARKEALANFDKDQGFRLWGTRHGGVYVPVTEDTPPSPYLSHIPERDIETPSGRKLTLLNSAYMVRQLMEDYTNLYGVRGKITGLVLLRPANAPDDWERAALLRLKAGADEVSEISNIGGASYLRLMRPMYMKPGCDKCHGHLGFKEGDFRGGVGVSVPIAPYLEARNSAMGVFAATHAGIWFLGIAGLGFGIRQVRSRISERDQAEDRLKASQERLAGILDIAPDAIITIDDDYNIRMFNHGAESVFGYSSDELLGKHLDILIPERFRAEHSEHIREFAESGVNSRAMKDRGQVVGLRQDGTEFPAEAAISMLEQDGQTLFTVHMHDISERWQAEQELHRAHQELEARVEDRTQELRQEVAERTRAEAEAEKASQAKTEFLSAMSHELRTPLNAILGFGQLLRDYPDKELTEEQRASVDQILDGGKHLLGLVNEVLDLSRIETGQLGLSLESVSVANTIDESLVLIQALANERGIAVIADATVTPELLVNADRSKFKQVLLNVLSNAVKYNRESGTVTLDAAAAGDGMWRINVRDTGPGIPADKHDDVFRPFSRLGAEASKIEGTGIGLSISRQLIESMGGSLDFESVVGQGSTFWIELPAA